jgi:drug/metabolite transporter (DMT)-like permease
MSITVLCSVAFMWWAQIPDWPLGAKDVRWLLVLRGVGGFFGVFGLYWSLQYLPLSDATVITFLSPTMACWACSKFIAEPFTRTEMYGGMVSLAGVILIARPTYLFSSSTGDDDSATIATSAGGVEPTPGQHLAAIGMAIVGVFGAASAYTTIRMIGHRAHPLISVTYFAFWCTLVSTVALVFVPAIPFVLPSTAYQWMLLVFIGLSGFIMQFLLTAGLRAEKSGRATNMLYLQMLFAIAAEKIIWGTSPGLWSLAGSTLILGAAGMVAMQKTAAVPASKMTSTEPARTAPASGRTSDLPRDEEEATGMLLHDAELHQLDDDSDNEDIEMHEKRGRSTATEDDEATIRHSLETADVEKRNTHLEPQEWNFQNARRQREVASLPDSEEVSPHTPELHRKGPVFWGK